MANVWKMVGLGAMAQLVEGLAAKPGHLNLVLGTHVMEGENQPLQVAL